MAKRGVPLRGLKYGTVEQSGKHVAQVLSFVQGIEVEKAKAIVKMIKDSKLKVQGSIQGDAVRVSGKNRDDLQTVQHPGVGAAERADPEREQRQRQRRRQREPQPARHPAQQPGPQDPEPDPDLRAGRAGQELAERDQVGERRLVDPATPRDVLGPEVADVRDRPAERGQSEPQRDPEHLERRTPGRRHRPG